MGLDVKGSCDRCRVRRAQKSISGTLCNFDVFRVKCLPAFGFRTRVCFCVCARTRVLVDLASWEVALDASSAKSTIQLGGPRNKMSEWTKVQFRDRPHHIVFFPGAAVGRRSAGAKYKSTRENSEGRTRMKR